MNLPTGIERLPKDSPLTWDDESYLEAGLCCVASPRSDDSPLSYLCTGPAGHAGPHVAEDGTRSLVRWWAK